MYVLCTCQLVEELEAAKGPIGRPDTPILPFNVR